MGRGGMQKRPGKAAGEEGSKTRGGRETNKGRKKKGIKKAVMV
jgi:hypothetical protein